jgi:hypothetical protein
LKKFMESVEQASGAIPAAMPREGEAEALDQNGFSGRKNGKPAESESAPTDLDGIESEEKPLEPESAWADVFSAGLSLLEKISGAVAQDQPKETNALMGKTHSTLPAGMIATEESTGRPYLKLPLPEPQVLQKIFDFINSLRGS